MLHALTAKAREERDAGFTLIEILVAMVLMAIVMSSLAVFFIGSQKSGTALRARQSAATVADQEMDRVHSLDPKNLLTGRDKTTSDTQWNLTLTAPNGTDVSKMTELVDNSAAAGTGALTSTALPTVPLSPAPVVNGVKYSVNFYIGACLVPRGGGDCTKPPAATTLYPKCLAPAATVCMDRVVVDITWTDRGSSCPNHTCAYVIASLINPDGDPVFSVNKIVLDVTPPTTPSSVDCAQSAATYTTLGGITWAAANDGSGIARYELYEGPSSTFNQLTWKKVGTYTTMPTTAPIDSGLVPATKYYYVVLAYDPANNQSTPQVPQGTVTTPQLPFMAACTTPADTTPPGTPAGTAPAGLKATLQTPTSVLLTWSPVTDDYKMGGYNIFRNGVKLNSAPLTTTSLVDTGLTSFTSYGYTVQAVDSFGNAGSQSAVVTIKTPDSQAPTAPAGLTLAATTPSEIDLAWTASTDDVGVTGYQVYRGITSSALSLVGTSPTPSYADKSLPGGFTYYYAVLANDAAGNLSALSSGANLPLADTTPPGVIAKPGGTSPSASKATVTWVASPASDGTVNYRVLRNGVLLTTVPSPGVSLAFTGLATGTFQVTVVAVDGAGNASTPSLPLNVIVATNGTVTFS